MVINLYLEIRLNNHFFEQYFKTKKQIQLNYG